MRTLQRLYVKDFLRLLILVAVGLSAVFSLLEVIDKIDDFMPGKPSAFSLFLYALFMMPKFLLYILPMSVLICSLFVFSQAFHRKEITALKAAGGRVKKLAYPFAIIGIALSILAFLTSEVIAPDFSRRALELKNRMKGTVRQASFQEGSLWMKGTDGSPVKIDLFSADKMSAQGIDIFIFGKAFLTKRIIAEKGNWNGSIWVLENVTLYDIGTGTIRELLTMDYPQLESPDLFAEDIKKPEEMGISELYRYAQRLKKAGFNNLKLIVDLNSKVTFPLINIFMMLIGISLSARVRLGGGLINAGLGLLISLAYWFSYTFMLSLGYATIIPPALSAWIIPCAFGALSGYLFWKIPE